MTMGIAGFRLGLEKGSAGLLLIVATEEVFKPDAVMSAVASARVMPVRSGMT